MSQQDIKEALVGLQRLLTSSGAGENLPLIDLMRGWLIITGLEFQDVVHLTAKDLADGLKRVYVKLGDSVDLLEEDTLQEAACRCLGTISVYGDLIIEEEVHVVQRQTVSWDGSTWNYVTDPKLRIRGSSPRYLEAITAAKATLGR